MTHDKFTGYGNLKVACKSKTFLYFFCSSVLRLMLTQMNSQPSLQTESELKQKEVNHPCGYISSYADTKRHSVGRIFAQRMQ